METSTTSIAIVGSGIAGMTLAAILSRQETPPKIEVFERDSRGRDQGTGFDVRGKAYVSHIKLNLRTQFYS